MGFEAAYRQRHALELLEDLDHTVLGRGPEGEQKHYDAERKLVKGEGRVELIGYVQYRAELREQADLPPEVKPEPKPKRLRKRKGPLGFDDLLNLSIDLGAEA